MNNEQQKKLDLFLVWRLDTGAYSALKSLRKHSVDADWWRACERAITDVVRLLHRRLAGEDVAAEMDAAAGAAADAVDRAYAYTYTDAVDRAYVYTGADFAAANAARAATFALYTARIDLIASLAEAQLKEENT